MATPSTPSMPGTPEASPAVSATLAFPVVGLGASAGGLESMLRFFGQMPAHPGMAFVAILHLSPSYESHADTILQRTADSRSWRRNTCFSRRSGPA